MCLGYLEVNYRERTSEWFAQNWHVDAAESLTMVRSRHGREVEAETGCRARSLEEGIPWWGEDSTLSLSRAWVQSLVGNTDPTRHKVQPKKIP